MTPETWAGIAERVGIPFTITIMVLMAVGIVGWVAGRWFAQKIAEPLITNHLLLIKILGETSVRDSQTLTELKGTVTTLAAKQEEAINVFSTNSKEVCEAVKDQTEKILTHLTATAATTAAAVVAAAAANANASAAKKE